MSQCQRVIKWEITSSKEQFTRYALIAGGLWKGNILNADMEELENMDASENLFSTNQRKRSIDQTRRRRTHILIRRWYSKIVRKRLRIPRTHSETGSSRKERNLREEFQGEPEESQPTELKDDAEARADFWSIQGDFIHRHHNEPRVQINEPKEATFPIPFIYFFKMWPDLRILIWTSSMKKRNHNYWNVRFEQKLVRLMERFHKFYIIEGKTSQGMYVVRWETDYKTRSCVAWGMVQDWKSRSESRISRMGNWKKQNLTMLDNWKEFILWIQMMKNITKQWRMQGKSWKLRWPPLCLVQERYTWTITVPETGTRVICISRGSENIVESHKRTRPRAELSQPDQHEDHIAGRGSTSMNHNNLVH